MKNSLYVLAFLITSFSISSCTSDDIEQENQTLIKAKTNNDLSLETNDSNDRSPDQNSNFSSDGDPLNPRPTRKD